MKKCPSCDILKSEDDFGKDKYKKDGLVSWCKKCISLKDKARYAKDPEKEKLRSKKWKDSNKERSKEVRKKWYHATKPEREKQRAINKDAIKSHGRKTYLKHKDEYRKKAKERYYANREFNIKRRQLWREKNLEKDKETQRQWLRNNKHKTQAYDAARKAAKKRALPPWADLQRIAEIYKNRPEGYHVDHIIPLRGKNVSGLHVEDNLQYLPAIENLKKGNRYE